MPPIIEATGVAKAFGSTKALAGVDLAVPEGSVVGLLGPNGAGKTTLVKVVATLLRPDTGSVSVGGHNALTEPAAVRSIIGLAGQFAAVDESLSGRENVEIVGRLYQLGRAESRRRAAEILERLGLAEAADRSVRTYSGGMRRRLDLGASLVGRPRILLLDEPTTGLDPATRNDLWDFIRDLVTDGTTVLLTTQYLEEADQLTDSVVVIDRGQVIASGTADELKERLGGDVLDVKVKSPADLGRVADLLSVVGKPSVTQRTGRVSVPVKDRVAALLTAANAINEAGIELDDIGVHRPSLDDVFLALTGHDAAESESASAQTRSAAGSRKRTRVAR